MPFARNKAALLGLVLSAGCAQPGLDAQIGRTAVLAPDPVAERDAEPERPALPADIVERSALPYHGVRLAGGDALEPDELFRELERADVICVGEHHDDPRHHYAQLEVARHLADRAPVRGRQMGLGFEMFQRRFQDALNGYATRAIDEAALLDAAEWEQRWNMDYALYRPLVSLGRERGMALLALNAPSELTRAVARGGLESLAPEQQHALPELDLDDAAHHAAFQRAMSQHPHGKHGSSERYYEAQVVWDESMAQAVADWLRGAVPVRQVVVFAGSAHCADWAIPSRIRRRVPQARVLSVLPVIDEPPGPDSGYDYAFVMSDDT